MLSSKLPIDIWKMIADKVQMLEIYDFNDEEFNGNLIRLREMLVGSDILLNVPLEFCRAEMNRELDIFLRALLQGVYSAKVFNDYKKANFYEKIYQLDELEIPSIEFNPIDFPLCVEGISLIKDTNDGEIIGIKNCFTDGEFKIGYVDSPLNRWYDLADLKDANYVLNILVDKKICGNVLNQEESYAILKNFDGIYPNRETMYEIRYPGLCTYSRYLDDGRRQLYLKQIFFPFDRGKAKYPKKLVRMKDNYHYE